MPVRNVRELPNGLTLMDVPTLCSGMLHVLVHHVPGFEVERVRSAGPVPQNQTMKEIHT